MSSQPKYPDATIENSHRVGIEFQDFVCIELAKTGVILQNLCSKKYQFEKGENLQGFEIKYDSRFLDTGRLSIEVAEKSKADNEKWIPSGIYARDDCWLYIQGNYSRIYIFSTNWLRRYCEEKSVPIKEFNGTIKRFFIPLQLCDRLAAKVLRFEVIPCTSL